MTDELRIRCPILRPQTAEPAPKRVEEPVEEDLEPIPDMVFKEIEADDLRRAQTLVALAVAALDAQKAVLLDLRTRRDHTNPAIGSLIAQIGLFAEIFQVQDAVADYVKR